MPEGEWRVVNCGQPSTSAKQEADILVLLASGRGLKFTARTVGVSVGVVERIRSGCIDYGAGVRTAMFYWASEFDIWNACDHFWGAGGIAREFGVSISRVKRVKKDRVSGECKVDICDLNRGRLAHNYLVDLFAAKKNANAAGGKFTADGAEESQSICVAHERRQDEQRTGAGRPKGSLCNGPRSQNLGGFRSGAGRKRGSKNKNGIKPRIARVRRTKTAEQLLAAKARYYEDRKRRLANNPAMAAEKRDSSEILRNKKAILRSLHNATIQATCFVDLITGE